MEQTLSSRLRQERNRPNKDIDELAGFHARQIEATKAADTHRFVLFGGARGPGKSYWLRWYCLHWLAWMGEFGLRNVRAGLFCNTYPELIDRQISKAEVEFPKWLGSFSQSKTQGYGFHFRKCYGGHSLLFRNLDDVEKYKSSEFALIAVDELTLQPRKTFDMLRGSLRWPRLTRPQLISATNPDGEYADWVRQIWIEKKYPKEYAKIAGEFFFVPALPTDNPYLPDTYLDDLEAQDDVIKAAWLHGDWYAMLQDGADQVCPRSWVLRAIERGKAMRERWDKGEVKMPAVTAIGVDVGRGGDDSVIASRRGNFVDQVQRFNERDTMVTASKVFVEIARHEKVKAFIDVIGVGAGVFDRVHDLAGELVFPFDASAAPEDGDSSGLLRFTNKRAEAWWRMRERLDPSRGENTCLPDDDRLVEELSTVKWWQTAGGKIQVESKDDIRERLGRSTDTADAVIMSFDVQEPGRKPKPAQKLAVSIG